MVTDLMLLLMFPGGTRGSENIHGFGAATGGTMWLRHWEGQVRQPLALNCVEQILSLSYWQAMCPSLQDNLPMDHCQEPQHNAVWWELAWGHTYGAAARYQAWNRELPCALQATVQVSYWAVAFCRRWGIDASPCSHISICGGMKKVEKVITFCIFYVSHS